MRNDEAIIRGLRFRNLNTQTHYKFVDENGTPIEENKVLGEVRSLDAKELSVKREFIQVSPDGQKPILYMLVNVLTYRLKRTIESLQKSSHIHYIVIDRDTFEAVLRSDLKHDKLVLPAPHRIHQRTFYWPELCQLKHSDVSNQIAVTQPTRYDLPALKLPVFSAAPPGGTPSE